MNMTQMPMSGWKVVYKERVYNVINMLPENYGDIEPKYSEVIHPKFISITFVDEDGMISSVTDEAFMFQFIRAVN